MRKHYLIICWLIFIVTGCSQIKEDYSNDYNPDTDYQYFFHEQGMRILTGVSEDGYYFLNNRYIYFADKNTMKPILLDNRPDADCLNKSGTNPINNCNAYVQLYSGEHPFLSYTNGKLYIIATDTVIEKDILVDRPALFELSKDGTERRKIFTFDFSPQAIAIHRGYVYYSSMDYSVESDRKYEIKQLQLNKRSANPKVIYEGTLDNGHISDIIPYGKNLYILEMGTNMYRTLRYDLENKSMVTLFDDDNSSNELIGAIANNKLIFTKFYGDPLDERSWHLFEANLDGEHVKKIPIERDFLSLVNADNQHFFVRTTWYYMTPELAEGKMDPNKLNVYDMDYNLIDSIDVSFLPIDNTIVTGDDNYMLVHYRQDGKEMIAALDKTKLGSGKAAFQPIIETMDEIGGVLRSSD